MGKRIILVTALVLGSVSPILAAQPDPSLMGYWTLDGDTQDSSGNNRHGIARGQCQSSSRGACRRRGTVPGRQRAIMSPSPVTKGSVPRGLSSIAFTVANWFRTTFDSGDREMVTWGTNVGGQRLSWRVYLGRLRTEHGSGNLMGTTRL